MPRDAMISLMEYRPVRTVREMWRLDLEAFASGYEFAMECDEPVNPHLVLRSFYLGWVSGSHDTGAIAPDADVEATRADMDLNMGHSCWVH
jgi:hypothetical protein